MTNTLNIDIIDDAVRKVFGPLCRKAEDKKAARNPVIR